MSIPSVLEATWKKVETRTPKALSVFLSHPSKPSPLCPPIGYLLGGHVIRLFHGHDEVVAIPGSDQSEEEQRCEKQLTLASGLTCPVPPLSLRSLKKLLTADALRSRGPKRLFLVSSVAANTDVTPAETGLQVGQQKPIYTLPGLCRCVSLCGVHM